jgi:epsilon-lactone hydrolase
MSTFAGMTRVIHLCLVSFLFTSGAAMAADTVPLSGTISPQARGVIEFLQTLGFKQIKAPAAEDLAGWKALHDANEKALEEPNRMVLGQLGATLKDDTINGVRVLDIRPKGWRDDGRVIVYVHGGAFTLFSARSMAGLGALVAQAAGMRVISVDYTTAPAFNWKGIQAQVGSVITGLVTGGTPLDRIAVFGDSAGGNLAISAVLELRDAGVGMPAAVLLFSPWADLSNTGDTAITLPAADPTLSYDGLMHGSALAYAGELDLKDPRVSPLYADFSKGFPPTLIQDGTRTILLSTSVRTYRALKAAKADATIDLYEGMWHVFQGAPAPEAQEALASAGAFLREKLK